MTPPTLRVRIGRLVLDGRVATGSQESIGEAIQTELASLLAERGTTADARGQTQSSLARSIAASIGGRLDAMSVRTQSPSASASQSPVASKEPVPRGTHG